MSVSSCLLLDDSFIFLTSTSVSLTFSDLPLTLTSTSFVVLVGRLPPPIPVLLNEIAPDNAFNTVLTSRTVQSSPFVILSNAIFVASEIP